MTVLRARLHLVTPPTGAASDILPLLEAALAAADVASVLLRLADLPERAAKDVVKAVAALVQGHDAALLLEDARLAARTGADGVHVRTAGEAFTDAMESLKPERIVGAGGALSRDDAMRLGEAGADYLMFGERADGTVSPDRETTLEEVGWWAEIFNIPCIAFAATLDEVETLAAAGAEFIALSDALWADPRGIAAAVGDAEAAIGRAAALLAGDAA